MAPRYWQSPSEMSTEDHLAYAISHACPMLWQQEELQKLTETRVLDNTLLELWGPNLLRRLVAVDPRGGHFCQKDMEEALNICANAATDDD